MPKHLLRLVEAAGYQQSALFADPLIFDITEDSRDVEPGWLFVAVPGTRENGERYIDDAIGRGAAAIVSEVPLRTAVPLVVVPNARHALADLAATIHDFPSRCVATFGVTGTDGKTTTSFLLASILKTAGHKTGIITTVETRAGGQTMAVKGRLTTPSAPLIQRTLAHMVNRGDACAVVECSSHALAQDRLRNVQLRAATITNIAEDHIEFHGSREAYAQAKAGIFDLLVPNGIAVINHDDSTVTALAKVVKQRVISFGFGVDASLYASDVRMSLNGIRFTVHWQDESLTASLPVPGAFNVYNALAAVGMAIAYGIDPLVAVSGLAQAEIPPGRLQRVDGGQPFSVYVDYAHTEQAFSTVLKFLSQTSRDKAGNLIAVFGAAGDRDRSKRPQLGRIAAATCDYFVITNEDPFSEDAAEIIAAVASGAPASTYDKQWTIHPDRREAIRQAFSHAQDGDVVVITGKGHESSIAMGAESIPWSDNDVALDILAEMGYRPAAARTNS